MNISLVVSELVGVIYDKLLNQYKAPANPESLRSLNKLYVRLVFCLYAEDVGIFADEKSSMIERAFMCICLVAKECKENSVPIIAITSFGENSLTQYATCKLTISTKESIYRNLGDYSSHLSMSLLLDVLYSSYFRLNMVKALLSILSVFHLIDPTGNTYYFLNFIADASYYFLPIFLATSAAKKFHCNTHMAMLMGAILLHPQFIALKDTADVTVKVLGLPVRMVTYSSSVIPIIMIVFTLSYVEKFVEKITPKVIKFVARPLLTILIMAPISFVVLGPLGSIIGDGLVAVLLSIEKLAPWVLPTVIGALMPFLVMTGMHYSLLPAYVNSLSALEYETIIGPGNLPSNIAQGAAALCVAVKTKNKEFRQLAVSD